MLGIVLLARSQAVLKKDVFPTWIMGMKCGFSLQEVVHPWTTGVVEVMLLTKAIARTLEEASHTFCRIPTINRSNSPSNERTTAGAQSADPELVNVEIEPSKDSTFRVLREGLRAHKATGTTAGATVNVMDSRAMT